MEETKGNLTTFYRNQVFKTIKENKFLIFFSIGLFLFSSISGVFIFQVLLDNNPEIIDSFVDQFKEMFGPISELSPFQLFLTIFYVNTRTSFLIMMLGALLGIFPFISLWLNGTILGILFGKYIAEGGNYLGFMMGILPHGIIEIPAIIIAASQGFRLGKEVVSPPTGLNRSEAIKLNITKGIKLFVLILPLLLIAAVIEVYISTYLFSTYG
ncbi:MAG TPA: stage II sporulation protein M [Methanofastidiosum sp.]|nr:stage II sporulation protein M [Methanofastidiosum sp.]HQK63171.1 stage II sporulation protein M [Methanofastidiosum sp.]HQM95269.1 stage II sporulation protein M [Methanofastidiosum sp.]HQQ48973.1 stage II sporulation protein M [Methanofastidiosum sp.]HRZ19942.1 stage II sporulation protein M [Methanofastidiosum sp.]